MNENSNEKYENRLYILYVMMIAVLAITVWGAVVTIKDMQNVNINQPQDTKDRAADKDRDNSSSEVDDVVDDTQSESVDMEQLAQEIIKGVSFETELSVIDNAVAEGMVELSQQSKMVLYMGSGSYSDELLLITSPDETAAEKDQDAVEEHLKDMRTSFESYIPEQAKKISDAVIIRSGCYVVACVTDDSENAKKIILSALDAKSGK